MYVCFLTCMQNGEIKIIDGHDLDESVVDVLIPVLPVPGSGSSGVALDVEEQNAVRSVRSQFAENGGKSFIRYDAIKPKILQPPL
jgi:hypothetical protein